MKTLANIDISLASHAAPGLPASGGSSGSGRSRDASYGASSLPTTTNTIRLPLSPPSHLRQLYEEARALPFHTRVARHEELYLELATLAATDRVEQE
jgi:hypothetical protein